MYNDQNHNYVSFNCNKIYGELWCYNSKLFVST